MAQVKIITIHEVNIATGDKTPHMIKYPHKKPFDEVLLPEIQKEYDALMPDGFKAVITVRKWNSPFLG